MTVNGVAGDEEALSPQMVAREHVRKELFFLQAFRTSVLFITAA